MQTVPCPCNPVVYKHDAWHETRVRSEQADLQRLSSCWHQYEHCLHHYTYIQDGWLYIQSVAADVSVNLVLAVAAMFVIVIGSTVQYDM